jgi:hypothetical protein
VAGVGAVIILVAIAGIANQQSSATPAPGSAGAGINTDATLGSRDPVVLTYLYYWYDASTMQHLEPGSGLPVHLPATPAPSWRSVDWFKKQLTDASYAGIDVVLPVYWGSGEAWSNGGLPVLARAGTELRASGQQPPRIGLFLDTTILTGMDLTSDKGKAFFYGAIRDYFRAIPKDQWATIEGRPIVFLYFSFFATAFDQGTFDYVYARFAADFGVRPYMVRELTWNLAKDQATGKTDANRPIATEASFKWGSALDGFLDRATVASVGPGFDERLIPGRGKAYRPREGGAWYQQNFDKAIKSGRSMIVIETWNEIHEASAIAETVEFGWTYLDLTRELVAAFRRAHPGGAT